MTAQSPPTRTGASRPSYLPERVDLASPSDVAHILRLSGSRHVEPLIRSGLLGSTYATQTSQLLVAADAVHTLSKVPIVEGPHPAALVLRVSAASPDEEPDTSRRFSGWSATADTEEALDGVRAYWRMSAASAAHVVDEPLPVVVTLRGWVVAPFLASSYERHRRLGVSFTVQTTDPTHRLLAPFAGRRLNTKSGGPIVWLGASGRERR